VGKSRVGETGQHKGFEDEMVEGDDATLQCEKSKKANCRSKGADKNIKRGKRNVAKGLMRRKKKGPKKDLAVFALQEAMRSMKPCRRNRKGEGEGPGCLAMVQV